jgi:hypothetical protein
VDCLRAAAAVAAAPWVEAATPVPERLRFVAGHPQDPIPHPSHGTCHLGCIPRGQTVALHLVNLYKRVQSNQLQIQNIHLSSGINSLLGMSLDTDKLR